MSSSHLDSRRSGSGSGSETAIRRLLPLAVVAAVLIAFAPAFEAELLHFDDDRNIAENPHFRGLGGEQLEWMLSTSWMGPYQPLAWLSLAVDHALFGLDAAAFHRTSVILHALGALALYALALRVLALAVPGAGPTRRALAATAAALFFAVHPLRVESVVWVTERRDVLSGALAILAAWAWTHAAPELERERPSRTRAAVAATAAAAAVALFWWSVDRSDPSRLHFQGPGALGLALGLAALAASSAASSRSGWYQLALALTFLALLAKGLVVVLPVALCVLDVWPIGRRASLRLVLEKLPFFALSAAFSALAVWGQASMVGTVVTWQDHGPPERLLQACYALCYYPARTLVPLGLSPIYELPDSIRISDWRFAAPALAVTALTAGLLLLRRRLPGALAAWVAFAALAWPVLGLFQRGPQLVADRYSYLACIPFALLAGGALAGSLRPGLALAGACLWLALAVPATSLYARAWQSSSALWEHAVEVDPESPMSLMSLAVARARQAAAESDPAQSRALLGEARELLARARDVSDDPRILGNLGRISAQLAELEPERRAQLLQESVELASEALAAARAQDVLLPEYYLALGLSLASAGRLKEALEHVERAAGAAPDDPEARFALASVLAALGRLKEAAEHVELAVRLAPESVPAWRLLAEVREATGQSAAAEQAWRRVLELAPEHARARERLAALRAGATGQ